MNRIIPIMVIICLCLYCGAGCARKAADDDKVLASVSNRFITVGEFKKRIEKLPSYYQTIADRNKKRFLDDMVVEMLFFEEAVRKGLDSDKEVREILREAKKKILSAKLIKTEVEDKIKINEADMKKYYEANKDEFKTQELWRASHILVATEGEAKEALDELAKGAAFEEVAKKHSIDATSSRGGDVGFFRAGQLVPDFEKTCLRLNVGETSGIVHTQFGFHIIKLTDKKESTVEQYENVKGQIEDKLKKARRSELFDELVAKLKVKYNVKIKDDVFAALETIKEKAKGK